MSRPEGDEKRALNDVVSAILATLQGVHWLMSCVGREGNWFWKWKLRTADRHVRFDTDTFGWPWFPETVSWVVSIAFAVIALNLIPCSRQRPGGLEGIIGTAGNERTCAAFGGEVHIWGEVGRGTTLVVEIPGSAAAQQVEGNAHLDS